MRPDAVRVLFTRQRHHLPVVRIDGLQGARGEGLGIGAAPARLLADPEQVGRGAVEVQTLAVDVHALEQALCIPARELLVLQVGDLAAHAFAHGGFVLVEVQADAVHALALERQDARIERAGLRQRFLDRALRAGEVTGVDLPDDRLHERACRGFRAGRDFACPRGRGDRLRGGKEKHGKERSCVHSRTLPKGRCNTCVTRDRRLVNNLFLAYKLSRIGYYIGAIPVHDDETQGRE
jgi:hypothetical protein